MRRDAVFPNGRVLPDYVVFFSSRRRHTRYPRVTGVQTCALPISGTGRWVYQFSPNAISAACAAAIVKADAPQRRTAAWSETSCSANAFTALAPPVEADQRDLEIARVAQQVHHLHQVAIADGLVGAQIDAFILVALGGGVDGGRQRIARNDVL